MTKERRVAAISKALKVLFDEDAVLELRVLKTSRGTVSGYFSDRTLLAEEAASLSGSAPGVYVTLNPVRRALLARTANRTVAYAERTTTDSDIVCRCWLLIDFDPVRPSGISATDAEHAAALKRAQRCMDWLRGRGFPDPVLADSGNGGHLLYRIDLPNDKESTQLIKDCLQALGLRFSDNKVTVDLSTYNASRICKVYGTLAAKGDNTPDRPHRRAKSLEVPSPIKIVKPALLEQLAATVPQPADGQRKKNNFDPGAWLAECGLNVVAEADWNGGHKWILNPCPWNPEHVNKAAYVVQLSSGAMAAGCLHASCADKNWADLRALFDSDEDPGQAQATLTQANRLLSLAEAIELFHTPDGEAFATVVVNEHKENWPLKSNQFRQWLLRGYFTKTKGAPQSNAVQEALGILESRARFDGAERPVFLRVAEKDGKIYLDLCNAQWEAVEIDGKDWRILPESPVQFRRARGMAALPLPTRGGDVEDLRPFVNVATNSDWILLESWLIAALRGRGPYPILVLHGEQGSAKSTTARVLRALVDPSTAPLRSEPREVRDLMIAATNGWIVSLDNISRLPPWLSDALCRLATGGGFSTRELYSDREETILEAQRPVILNGIEELAVRGDLLDRALMLDLPSIPEEKRRAELSFWTKFEACRSAILGALLDAVSSALRRLPKVRLPEMPRMADFALWATAAEYSLGWDDGSFLLAYTGNQSNANALALDASPITEPLRAVVADGEFIGTATALLKKLEGKSDEATQRQKGWPKNGQGVSNTLRRLAPNLRKSGIKVDFNREKNRRRRRFISLREIASTSSTVSTKPSADKVGRG